MKTLTLVLAVFLMWAPVSVAHAQEGGGGSFPGGGGSYTGGGGSYTGGGGSVELENPIKEDTIAGLFKAVMDAIFIIALPFFVLAMAFVGLLFVAARGNPEKLAKAKNAFLYAVVGTGVFFGAWVLVNILASLMRTLGVPI